MKPRTWQHLCKRPDGQIIEVANPTDHDFYDRGPDAGAYIVYLCDLAVPILAFGEHVMDAIDWAADYARTQGYLGYFIDNDDPDLEDRGDDGLFYLGEEVYHCGDSGMMVVNHSLRAFKA